MSIPQKSIVRHDVLYSRFFSPLRRNDVRHGFEEAATEHVGVKAGESAERKKETDSLAPFAPFCARLSSTRGGTRERILAFSDSSRLGITAGLCARFLFATCFRLRREREASKSETTDDVHGKSYGEARLPAAAVTAVVVFFFLAEDTPGQCFRIQEEETRKEWEQGSDRRRHAPLRLRYLSDLINVSSAEPVGSRRATRAGRRFRG